MNKNGIVVGLGFSASPGGSSVPLCDLSGVDGGGGEPTPHPIFKPQHGSAWYLTAMRHGLDQAYYDPSEQDKQRSIGLIDCALSLSRTCLK